MVCEYFARAASLQSYERKVSDYQTQIVNDNAYPIRNLLFLMGKILSR
jgi:hypothetical protein